MSPEPMPSHLSATLYIVAGAMFVVGAFASDRIAFSGVGIAFIALGVTMLVRQRRK
ncbi:MFS transporter [Luteimonas sp. RIT-PG2_3]|jgi:hypothetical protein